MLIMSFLNLVRLLGPSLGLDTLFRLTLSTVFNYQSLMFPYLSFGV